MTVAVSRRSTDQSTNTSQSWMQASGRVGNNPNVLEGTARHGDYAGALVEYNWHFHAASRRQP